MNLRRLGKMAPVLFGTVVLVGGVIATIAGRGMADVKNAHPAAIEDRGIENGGPGRRPGDIALPPFLGNFNRHLSHGGMLCDSLPPARRPATNSKTESAAKGISIHRERRSALL